MTTRIRAGFGAVVFLAALTTTTPAVAGDAEASAQEAAVPTRKLADTEEYTVTVELPSGAQAGKPTEVTLVVVPKKGWKLNREFPTKLTVEAPDGVTVAKSEQTYDDAERFDEKTGADWRVEFTAAAGEQAFTGKLRFAVCTAETCNPRRESLAFAVAVK